MIWAFSTRTELPSVPTKRFTPFFPAVGFVTVTGAPSSRVNMRILCPLVGDTNGAEWTPKTWARTSPVTLAKECRDVGRSQAEASTGCWLPGLGRYLTGAEMASANGTGTNSVVRYPTIWTKNKCSMKGMTQVQKVSTIRVIRMKKYTRRDSVRGRLTVCFVINKNKWDGIKATVQSGLLKRNIPFRLIQHFDANGRRSEETVMPHSLPKVFAKLDLNRLTDTHLTHYLLFYNV